MKQFFCSIGSNLQNPQKNVLKALEKIRNLGGIFQFRSSHLYLTTPVSEIEQPDFINAACSFRTALQPKEVLRQTQAIERDMGKVPKAKNAPRIIDIDILYVEGCFSKDPSLILPHPGLLSRLFVAKPLSELCNSLKINREGVSEDISIKLQAAHLEEVSGDEVIQLKSI